MRYEILAALKIGKTWRAVAPFQIECSENSKLHIARASLTFHHPALIARCERASISITAPNEQGAFTRPEGSHYLSPSAGGLVYEIDLDF